MEQFPESDYPSSAEEIAGENWQPLGTPLPPVGILAGLSDESLQNLAAFGRAQTYPVDVLIIKEGEPQDRFYIVVSGKLAVSALAAGHEVPLSIAEEGECLGEVTLLEPDSASATVRVLEEAILWSMNLDDLRVYLSEHAGGGGALLMGMAQCLSQRLRQANQLIAQHHVTPVEMLPSRRDRAITADNTPVHLGFFDLLKRSFHGEKKVHISTEIKL
jgi:CRP-like cAMP-binding protein